VQVLNKIDLAGLAPAVERDECGTIARVFSSARTGAGLDLVRLALDEASPERLSRNVATA
jgi:GTP-binding protein HflX